MSPYRRIAWCFAGLASLFVNAGCQDFVAKLDEMFKRDQPAPTSAPAPEKRRDPILADTVGSVTLLGDAVPMRLRGFGVVIGLGENGGTDSPTSVREYLLDYFAKEFAPKGSGERRDMSPQKLLDSRDSAVVSISGIVIPGAPAGTVFDVQVEALGSDTRSIEGGMLLPCELKIFDSNASGTAILAGRTLAKARGPVYTNSAPAGAADGLGPRSGFVLGGARTIEDRNQKLMLEEPSYNTARRVERRINERLGQSPQVASANSAGEVTLRTPPMYAGRPERLAELTTHLLLDSGAGGVDRRVKELTDEVGKAGPKLKNISSIWEGVGRTTLPQIQPLYSHADPEVAFYAARAGIRLRDAGALSAMGQIAATAGNPNRIAAIRELGTCGMNQAVVRLVPLVDQEDAEVRIAAYEALLNYRHPAIQTIAIPAALDRTLPGVILDVIASRGPPLIYARRTREPRIAIFGAKMPVNLPIYYTRPDEAITLNANERRGDITMFCRTRRNRLLSDKIMVPPRVDELIRAMATPPVRDEAKVFRGIGLHYSLIVQVLDDLCRDGSIAAQFKLEPAPLLDSTGPSLPADRPETEDDKPVEPKPERTSESETDTRPERPKKDAGKVPLLPDAPKDRPE